MILQSILYKWLHDIIFPSRTHPSHYHIITSHHFTSSFTSPFTSPAPSRVWRGWGVGSLCKGKSSLYICSCIHHLEMFEASKVSNVVHSIYICM